MKVDVINSRTNFRTRAKGSNAENPTRLANNSASDVFIKNKNATETNFEGAAVKKVLTPAEKKSKDINFQVNMLHVMCDHVKERAKEEAKRVDRYFTSGVLTYGTSYTTPIGKKYQLSDTDFRTFTLFEPRHTTLETETLVTKGRAIRCVETNSKQGEVVEGVYEFNKNGFMYTEKVKDYDGRKIHTNKKVNLVYRNGIGKSYYTERNEDGTFSTYIYKGAKDRIMPASLDFYNPQKAVWEKCGEDTMNLAAAIPVVRSA